jgi:Flp pilus assembly protein TadB
MKTVYYYGAVCCAALAVAGIIRHWPHLTMILIAIDGMAFCHLYLVSTKDEAEKEAKNA